MAKIQSALYTIFLILFIPIMAVIAVMFIDYASEPKYLYYPVILFAVFIGALFVLKKGCHKFDSRLYYPALFLLSTVLFIIQFVIYKDSPELILHGDYRAMYSGFVEISSYGELTGYLEYFLAHRHQIFAAFFYGVLNRIFVMLGLSGPVNITATIVTNCILINAGGILLSFAVKNIAGKAYSLLTMFLFCMFNSYWGCMLYAYTHTLSIFFMGLMIFFFSCFVKAKQEKFKILWLAISGFAFAFCKSSEGITLIAFVAALIYIAISSDQIKKITMHILPFVASFVLCLAMIDGVYGILGIIDETDSYKYEFPLTHWIMMGQGETGNYNEDDYQATVHIEGKDEKFEYHKAEILRRVTSRSFGETIKFWMGKQREAWIGGTYGVRTDFPDNFAYNYAHRLFLVLSVLAGAILSIVNTIKNKYKTVPFLAFSQIYTIGVFLFFCIWEVSYAYLFSSIPMLILCAVLSLYTIIEKPYIEKDN